MKRLPDSSTAGLVLLLVLGLLVTGTFPARAADFSAADEGELAAAISAANDAGPGTHRITLTADIALTGALPALDNADAATIVIQGEGHTLTGDDAHTVLVVQSGTTATFVRLTVTGGRGSEGPSADWGGGIYNEGNLRLERVTLSGNAAASGGGAANVSEGGRKAVLTVIQSTVRGNTAGSAGGLANVAGSGGDAALTLVNSTVSGNLATDGPGGGLANTAAGGSAGTILLYATLAANAAASGGGNLHVEGTGGASTAHMAASLIGRAAGQGAACAAAGGYLTSTGFNLDEDGTCGLTLPSDYPKAIANLMPLAAGPGDDTATHALGFGSMALDGVPRIAVGCGGVYAVDQRGRPRPETSGGRCDIGAYEAETTPAAGYWQFAPFVGR
jgi:hypothetical protein